MYQKSKYITLYYINCFAYGSVIKITYMYVHMCTCMYIHTHSHIMPVIFLFCLFCFITRTPLGNRYRKTSLKRECFLCCNFGALQKLIIMTQSYAGSKQLGQGQGNYAHNILFRISYNFLHDMHYSQDYFQNKIKIS